MTIQRDAPWHWDVSCDDCGEITRHEGGRDAMMTIVEAIKREGWKITKRFGQWAHICKGCK